MQVLTLGFKRIYGMSEIEICSIFLFIEHILQQRLLYDKDICITMENTYFTEVVISMTKKCNASSPPPPQKIQNAIPNILF